MLPAYAYRMARHRARYHVQVRLDRVESPVRTPCFVQVAATVAVVFRGSDSLAEGDPVAFGIGVTRPGDDLPFGGVVWTPYDELVKARYAEVFLNGEPPDCEVALSQCRLIEAPSAQPAMRGTYRVEAARDTGRRWLWRPKRRS